MNRLLQNFHADAKEEPRKETIRSVYKYLNNHWGAIQARWHYQLLLITLFDRILLTIGGRQRQSIAPA